MSTRAPLVSARADHVVCVGAATSWTAGQLRGDVARLAATLGDAREAMVLCQGRYAFAVALLACWSRRVRVRLPPDGAAETLASLGQAMDAVLRDDDGIGTDVRPYLTGEPGAVEVSAPPDDEIVVVLSTSGSTGEMRSIPKTAGQLLAEATMLSQQFDVGGDVVVATVPPRHIYGLLFSLLVPLTSGGCFVDETPFFDEAVSAVILATSADVLVTVPAHLRALTAKPLVGLGQLSRVFSSGAPLDVATAELLAAQHQLPATEVFGSTETGGIAWRHQLVSADWTVLPGVTVSVVEGDRLGVCSPYLPPDGPRPWVSDDRVKLLSADRFEHRGRADDVVKVASRRVSLGAVTSHLLSVEGVEDAAVVAVTSGQRTRLKALVVAPELDAATIREQLAGVVEGVAMPRLVWTDQLPRTSHGKLPRQVVIEALEDAEHPPDGMEWRAWSSAVDRAEGLVVVRPDSPWFEGHFPDNPVLPGVAQLHGLVVRAVRRAWRDLEAVRGIPRVRFQAPVRPGEKIWVRLSRQASTIRFVLEYGEVRFTAGAVEMGEVGAS